METAKKNYKPKVDPALNQEVHLKLLKDKPHIGESTNGKYFLYSVEDIADGTEKSFFAPEYVHDAIQRNNLKSGSEFKIKKIADQDTNTKKTVTRLELALVASNGSNGNGTHKAEEPDSLKAIMLQCVKDSVEIVNSVKEVPFQTCDIRSIAATLFIGRTKQFA